LNPNTEKEKDLGNIDVLTIGPGDVIHVASGGAGGWGNPFERNSELVLQDIQRGFVSEQSAKNLYGVIMKNGIIDENGTNKLRKTALGQRSLNTNIFDYGEGRTAFELVWTRKNYELLTTLLAASPVHWRFFIKHRIFKSIGDKVSDQNHKRIYECFNHLLEEFPQLNEAVKR
jgi:N-methylhydantoinase B